MEKWICLICIAVFARLSSALCYRALNTKGAGGGATPPPPSFLADQLTLFQPEVTDYAHHINTSPSSTHRIFRPSYGPVLSDLSILRARITEICAAHKGSSHGIPRRPFSDHIT